MTLSELRTALQARGFNHLSSSEQTAYLNWAYLIDICEVEDWQFLQASSSGSSPLTITDLRTVESVYDSTNDQKLVPWDRRQVTDLDPGADDTGTPFAYYITSGTTVNTYPTTSVTLTVKYWKAPTELSGDSDEPLLPSRFHRLIVDGAVRRAYESGDEYDAAQAAANIFYERLEQMRDSLLVPQHDRPQQGIVVEDYSADW